MDRMRRLAPAVLAVAFVLLIAACGKKGEPQPPPGEPVTYPRNYPSE
jgi:predicted small lipoprotein YifL